MYPFIGLFGQTTRLFHSPDFEELREALTETPPSAAAGATVTEMPRRQEAVEVPASRAA